MAKLISEKIENNTLIREFEKENGEITVIHTFLGDSLTQESPIEPQPTLDAIAEETLLETKYQTLLLEMML